MMQGWIQKPIKGAKQEATRPMVAKNVVVIRTGEETVKDQEGEALHLHLSKAAAIPKVLIRKAILQHNFEG